LEQVGALDEGYFLYCEDVDWMMRFLQQGWQILFVPDAEIVHVKGVCSRKIPFRVLWYKHKGMMRFYHKFFRQRYSFILMWVVYVTIWIRFVMLMIATLVNLQRRLFEV
jgi:GT2 family glycosyltransferase